MNKFKVGDRVENISTGVCGTVFELYKNIVYVDIEDKNHGVKYGGRQHVWCLPELNFRLAKPNTYELHITCNDSKTTNAVYKVNGKIEKRTEAVCCPSDTFDFAIGAQTAFDRVFPKPINIQSDTHPCATQPIAPQEDKPRYKVGDKVKVVRDGQKYPSYKEWFEISKIDYRIARCFNHGKTIKNGDIVTVVASGMHERKSDGMLYAVETEDGGAYIIAEIGIEPYAEPEKELEPAFVPYLSYLSKHYGIIGTPTKFKDAVGRPLFVGDEVEKFDCNGESIGLAFLVNAELSYRGDKKKVFVNGIESSCNDELGTISGWSVLKNRSYSAIKNEESINGIIFIGEA